MKNKDVSIAYFVVKKLTLIGKKRLKSEQGNVHKNFGKAFLM